MNLEHYLIYAVLGATTLLNIVVPVSGSAVVVPLLALLTDPHQAIGVASAFFVMSGVVRIFMFRKSIRWREVRVLLLPSVLAAALGAFSLFAIPPEALLVIIFCFSSYFLLRRLHVVKFKPRSSTFNHFIGILSGFLQGTGLAGSDLRNQYLYAEGLDIAEVHGTSSIIGTSNFLAATLVRLYTGALTLPLLWPLIYLFPIVVISIWAGRRVLNRIPKKVSEYIVAGVMLFVLITLAREILITWP